MFIQNCAKTLLMTSSLLALSGCGLANLASGYTEVEKQTLNELSGANYVPRSAQQREAILTQDLFAQAAFWSREYDLNPADLEAAVNLANTLRRLGNPEKAIEVATHTRALYPRDVDLMTELAASLVSSSRPQDALTIVETALRTRPNTARLWSIRGAAYDRLEQFDLARQSYSKALGLEPNNVGTLANIGLSFALEGDPETAEIWLRRAVNTPGASPGIRQNLALVLGLQGKYQEAEQWANRDLNAAETSQNMKYLRSLRGRSNSTVTPPPATQYQRAPTPQMPAPITRPSSVRPSQSNALQPKTYGSLTPQSPAPGTRLTVNNNTARGNTGPRTASDAARAAAAQGRAARQQPTSLPAQAMPVTSPYQRNTPAYAPSYQQRTNTYQQPPASSRQRSSLQQKPLLKPATYQQAQAEQPLNILQRISNKNTPKTVIASNQRNQRVQRTQNSQAYAQNQMRARGGSLAGAPQYQQPVYAPQQQGYGYNTEPVEQNGAPYRAPARSRR
jgi:Flp pilus assembly protein TadD